MTDLMIEALAAIDAELAGLEVRREKLSDARAALAALAPTVEAAVPTKGNGIVKPVTDDDVLTAIAGAGAVGIKYGPLNTALGGRMTPRSLSRLREAGCIKQTGSVWQFVQR